MQRYTHWGQLWSLPPAFRKVGRRSVLPLASPAVGRRWLAHTADFALAPDEPVVDLRDFEQPGTMTRRSLLSLGNPWM